jgi:hypothetical protein
MSVWDKYPEISGAEMRTLVAITAQLLLDSDDGNQFPQDLLLQSTATSARGIQKELRSKEPAISPRDVQRMLEDDELAISVCRAVLDQVNKMPDLAAKIEQEFEARSQKMTGIETALLVGALVILATRIKRIKWGSSEGSIDFEPAGNAVKTFIVGLMKTITPGLP